jgi:hypothetical protein
VGRKYSLTISRNHLVVSLVGLLLFVSGTAYGISVGNTPDTGYLLCANQKTRALTYPGKLSCPTGTSPLALGAQGPAGQDGADGAQGPQGLQGPQGPQGPQGLSDSQQTWFWNIQPRDIVAPTAATNFAGLKKTIVADISKKNLTGSNWFSLRAVLQGIWADTSRPNAYVQCYFQDASAYPSGAIYYGSGSATNNTWTGINMVVYGDTSDYGLSQSDLYLVCATDGTISGLSGNIHVTSSTTQTGLGLNPPPSS